MMKKMAATAAIEGKKTNSSGQKTTIQSLCRKFDPLEISELNVYADPKAISSPSHNSKSQQRLMSTQVQ